MKNLVLVALLFFVSASCFADLTPEQIKLRKKSLRRIFRSAYLRSRYEQRGSVNFGLHNATEQELKARGIDRPLKRPSHFSVEIVFNNNPPAPRTQLSVLIRRDNNQLLYDTIYVTGKETADSYAVVYKGQDKKHGLDFEISINIFGELNMTLWSGGGSIEKRHALADYRHEVHINTSAEVDGRTRLHPDDAKYHRVGERTYIALGCPSLLIP